MYKDMQLAVHNNVVFEANNAGDYGGAVSLLSDGGPYLFCCYMFEHFFGG